jgi:ABC-2 type transport system permease protein
MYMGSILSLYNPDSAQAMEETLKLIPEELARAMGIGNVPADLTGFLGNYFYSMLVFMIPLIYVSIMGNRLMAKMVDNGSMAYLLSTPNNRVKIALTQGIYYLLGIAVLFVFLTGVTIGMSQAMYPNLLDIPAFILLNTCAFLLTCAISAICWFFSCLFNDTKYSLAFGVGIPVLFFMLNMFGGIKEELGWLTSLSLYRLFRAAEILSGSTNTLGICLVFAAIVFGLYTGGIYVFKRKNLPI